MNIMITGASRGIGLATAKQLAAKGHSVGLFDISRDTLEDAVEDKAFAKAQKQQRIVHGYLDVTKPDDWENAISQMIDAFGSIDTLINNAGVLVTGILPSTSLERQLALVDINCKGVLIGCHKLAPYLADADNGKIINLSSASAIYGQSEIAPYSASKFFVRGLTEALNVEYESLGIKVVDVMPLWVKSDMTKGESVTSIERLGVNLSVDDVAKTLCKLTCRPNRRINCTHYPVGMPAKVLQKLAQVTPDPMVRWLNNKMSAKQS